jgi:hypothetical protein
MDGKPPKHGFHHTEIHHHGDGSHTIHHHHVEPEKSVSHAVPDHDSMMDSMQQHLGEAPAGPEATSAPMPTTAAIPAGGGGPPNL